MAAAPPDLHQSFWIAIATAAPIIGLASAVNADQAIRRAERAIELLFREGTPLSGSQTSPFIIASCNILLQAGLLGLALYCLGSRYDSSPWRVVGAAAAVGGVFLVFLPTVWPLLRGGSVTFQGPGAGARGSRG